MFVSFVRLFTKALVPAVVAMFKYGTMVRCCCINNTRHSTVQYGRSSTTVYILKGLRTVEFSLACYDGLRKRSISAYLWSLDQHCGWCLDELGERERERERVRDRQREKCTCTCILYNYITCTCVCSVYGEFSNNYSWIWQNWLNFSTVLSIS